MIKGTKKGFTLVELIVVITILAILWTIAFISLQGYSGDARDSRRITETADLAKKVSIELAKSVDIKKILWDAQTGSISGTLLGENIDALSEAYKYKWSTWTVVGTSILWGTWDIIQTYFAIYTQSGERLGSGWLIWAWYFGSGSLEDYINRN
jgi:prepilin-type N-terminal cleavage/methylation domain-containing protein